MSYTTPTTTTTAAALVVVFVVVVVNIGVFREKHLCSEGVK